MKTHRRAVLTGAAAVALTPWIGSFSSQQASARPILTTRYGFNDRQIAWRLFESGAREAKRDAKPIFFLVHATWCHHCLAYRRLFFDPEVVRRLKRFSTILVDADAQPEINERYAPTGPYVPRTMFLDAKADLMPDLHLGYPEFEYFVDYLDGPNDLRRLIGLAEKRFFRA